MTGFTIVSGRVRDANNVLVPIRGISHYGFGTLGWPTLLWQQNWQFQLDQIKSFGFNAVRCVVGSFTVHSALICPNTFNQGAGTCSASINPDLQGKTAMQILDMWMAYCDKIGLYVMIDMHGVLNPGTRRGVWHSNTDTDANTWNGLPYTKADWIADCVFLATRYLSNPHFLAFDVFNEPHEEGLGHPRWDSGDPLMTNPLDYYRPAVEDCGAALLAANPNVIIGVQGCGRNWDGIEVNLPLNWGESLQAQGYKPLNVAKIPANKTMFLPHTYGPDVFVKSSFTDPSFPANLAAEWETNFGYLFPTFAVMPGEWGGWYGTGTGSGGGAYPPGITAASDKTWQDAFVAWMTSKGMHDSWFWTYVNSPDSGAILDTSLNVRQDKLTLLQSHWAIQSVALTIPRNTTFDTRAFAPYIKNALPAQSGTVGVQTQPIAGAFYIAAPPGSAWSTTGLPAGLGPINPSTGVIPAGTPTTAATTSFRITCTPPVGPAVSTVAVNWVVSAAASVDIVLPDFLAPLGQQVVYDLARYKTVPAGYVYTSLVLEVGTFPAGWTLDSAAQTLTAAATGRTAVGVTGLRMRITADSVAVSLLTTFSLTSVPGGTLLPFTIGHPFKQGDVPSGSYVTSPLADFQADVRNHWSDGSLKFAVLSGKQTLTAAGSAIVTIQKTTTPPTGANIGEPLDTYLDANVSVTLTGVGAGIYTPKLARQAGITPWTRATPRKLREFLGPVMSEFHYYQPTSDGHLTIWWYVRAYSDRISVETSIEQGWTKIAGSALKSYAVTVNIGGTQRYAAPIGHMHHSRWSRIDWIGTDPQITPKHDRVYLGSTKLVPNYGTSTVLASSGGVGNQNTGLNGYVQSAAPMTRGNFDADARSGGAHNHLGILSEWDAAYICSGDIRAFRGMLANEQAAHTVDWTSGTGGGFVNRDETTGLPAAHTDYLTASYSTGAGGLVFGTGGSAFVSDIAHSLAAPGYLPYLTTGRWFSLETLQFCSISEFLSWGQAANETTTDTRYRHAEDRGSAWGIRTLAAAAAVTPDSGHISRAKYITELQNYINVWNTVEVGFNTLGLKKNVGSQASTPYDWGTGPPQQSAGMFMQYFITQCFAFARDIMRDSVNGAAQTSFDTVVNFHCSLPVGLLGTVGGFSYRSAAAYGYNVGPTVGTFYSDFLTWYNALATAGMIPGGDSKAPGQSLISGNIPDMTSYWGNFMPAICAAVDLGVSGAAAAYARMTGASNWSALAGDMPAAPQWATVPR